MRDGLLRDFSAGYVMHPFAALHAQIAENGLDGNVDAKEDIGDKGGQMEHQAADQSQGDGKQPKGQNIHIHGIFGRRRPA